MTQDKKTKTLKSETRLVTIEFRGQKIQAVALGEELVGLLAPLPKGTGHPDWGKAIDKAVKGA